MPVGGREVEEGVEGGAQQLHTGMWDKMGGRTLLLTNCQVYLNCNQPTAPVRDKHPVYHYLSSFPGSPQGVWE